MTTAGAPRHAWVTLASASMVAGTAGGLGASSLPTPCTHSNAPSCGNTQAVNTRQGLLVGHKDVAVAHGVFDAETVGVHVIRHLLCHDRIFDLVGRPRGGFVTRRGPVDLVPVLGVVVSGHIDGVPLLDLQQGHYRRIGQGVLAACVAAVCQPTLFSTMTLTFFTAWMGG